MTAQQPLNSGFGPHSTTKDVLADIDLSGKLAIVTGGYSGLGLETTRVLTEAGAHVVVPARRPILATEALGEDAEVAALDLGDLDSVRAFAENFLATGRGIDLIINNAGVMASPEVRMGPGWEMQFAVNHLGHFALVNQLWPALRGRDARVVSVSSAGHYYSDIRWEDPQFATGYDKWQAYGQSKTANVLHAVHLDALGREQGVRAFAVHPGGIMTQLARHIPLAEQIANGWVDAEGNPDSTRLKSIPAGAATQVWAATSPRLAGEGGVYLADCEVAPLGGSAQNPIGVAPYAVDADSAARLWALSAELTGTDLPR